MKIDSDTLEIVDSTRNLRLTVDGEIQHTSK